MKKAVKFQDRLKETEESIKSRRESRYMHDFRQFNAIQCGHYWVSIQGSSGHYCTPRATVPANEYTSMEIAVFGKRSKGNFLNMNRSLLLRLFPRYSELTSYADGPQPTVFGYVPVDLIQDLINYMES